MTLIVEPFLWHWFRQRVKNALYSFPQSKSSVHFGAFTLVFSFSGEGIGGAGLGGERFASLLLISSQLILLWNGSGEGNQPDWLPGWILSILFTPWTTLDMSSFTPHVSMFSQKGKGGPREDLWDWEYCAKQHLRITERLSFESEITTWEGKNPVLLSPAVSERSDVNSSRLWTNGFNSCSKENGSSGFEFAGMV